MANSFKFKKSRFKTFKIEAKVIIFLKKCTINFK